MIKRVRCAIRSSSTSGMNSLSKQRTPWLSTKLGKPVNVHMSCSVQRPDSRWVRYVGVPIGTTDMDLWIGALTEKPEHLHEGGFDLSITTPDDLLS